jgi:hypothetical protein
MPITNDRIYALAVQALALSNNDIARAVHILSELTGISPATAFEAIDHVLPPDFDTDARRS